MSWDDKWFFFRKKASLKFSKKLFENIYIIQINLKKENKSMVVFEIKKIHAAV